MSQQKIKITIDKRYRPKERKAIAQEILAFIRERSKAGKDKNGRRFPGYSKSYKESLDFRNAGKSKGRVNLTLSGDMLDSLEHLADSPGNITLGFDKEDKEANDKAEGNILGTYGQASPIPGKKRDFLGISKKDLKRILKKYPLDDREERNLRAQLIERIFNSADDQVQGLTLQQLNQLIEEENANPV